MHDLVLGIDVGTSGVRAAIVDESGRCQCFASTAIAPPINIGGHATQDPADWWRATRYVLANLSQRIDLKRIGAIAVDGTSGTVLGVDVTGRPVAPAQMYNSTARAQMVQNIAAIIASETPAREHTSTLAKCLVLQRKRAVASLMPQASWISGQFSGQFKVTDENNALKLGYDPVSRAWPDWIEKIGIRRENFPTVVPAGTVTGEIAQRCAHETGLAADVVIVAGTTDGCAAFLATGADQYGQAVTSLGTTLVLKVLSDRPLFSANFGIYSHRMGKAWLAGGASNSGGAAMAQHFCLDRIISLSSKMLADVPTGFDYYPLPGRGERFPICDAEMMPHVDPRPNDDVVFLQALFEGIANIEKRGYDLLTELGGRKIASVRAVGGGAKNPAWRVIRSRTLDLPLIDPVEEEAAVGAGILAWRGLIGLIVG
jgi:D-ribulokinase